ncbi:hypothetical protein MPNT_100057 [Candidatus Methylacidithermus pantelleriae]|uniref:Uncharacterized protein n=1 Tax=Candidatus Methylacidithermus pantelleriae TaxID=2744239 RepID=A0A8J2BRB8_9BACT|nr:hypothetical protein MPNT_100057 [Candidatus Methylacidithermus pantelleriae]
MSKEGRSPALAKQLPTGTLIVRSVAAPLDGLSFSTRVSKR